MPLFGNQANAEAHLSDWKVGALFMEAGTGKTRVACDIANSTDCDLIVWVGPYQTIHTKTGISSVMDEINKWGGFRSEVMYMGIESLQSSDRIYLNLRDKISNASKPFIIVDESLKIKNAAAKRTKRMMELSAMVDYKLILNGTPISKNLLDLKPQMDFLSPAILNMSDMQYKNTFCKYIRVTKLFKDRGYTKEFVTGFENVDYLYSLIRHYIFECDLKLMIKQFYQTIDYIVTAEEKALYNLIKEKYLDNEMLMWKNNNIFLEMTQKMQHSYCCAHNKFEVLNSLFKEIDQSRTIIFCKFIKSQKACEKFFPKATILSYQKNAYGLNLQHLNNTIYFDKNWDLALRVQSSRRTYRIGQEIDCKYWDLTGDMGLDFLIDNNIKKKIGQSEYLKRISTHGIKKELEKVL